jgi:hypothetical protein
MERGSWRKLDELKAMNDMAGFYPVLISSQIDNV